MALKTRQMGIKRESLYKTRKQQFLLACNTNIANPGAWDVNDGNGSTNIIAI